MLMLAWMDDEAERRTRETGEAQFWSRSRQALWHKGETSGNTLAVEELRDDCDGDALLLRVPPTARRATPARSPASRRGSGARIGERAETSPRARTSPASSTRRRGRVRAEGRRGGRRGGARGASEDDRRVIEELADLWFHPYVALAARGLDPAAVEDELARRAKPA